MKKIVVFGSGNGSNFQAIAEYFKYKNVEIVCVSDKKDAYILKRAEKLGIKNFYVAFENTEGFLNDNEFDLIVLAGYMRIFPEEIFKERRIVNIHPSLLPKYKGINAIKRAYEAKEDYTGISVHFVEKEVDSGELLAQALVKIEKDMTLEELEAEIHRQEHILYPQVIEKLLLEGAE